MTRPAVRPRRAGTPCPSRSTSVLLQAGWKLLFFHPKPFEANPAKDAAWNRGAYLASGLSHCGACHTPCNILGAEKQAQAYAGAAIDNWVAPPLDRSNPSPLPWDKAGPVAYLRHRGQPLSRDGAGPMAPVTRELAALPVGYRGDRHLFRRHQTQTARASIRR